MRVLAIGAHPDDIEILCAGTLLRYKQEGHQVCMAIATNGDQGHYSIMPKELAEIRHKEAQKSADLLGAEKLFWMAYPDEFIYHDHDTRMKFIKMLRDAKPDVIITHNPNDYHQDHRIVSDIVYAASFIATLPHVETGQDHLPYAPPLYYMSSLAGAQFVPQEYVDITSVAELKWKMMECHESQVKWLKEHDNVDIVEFIQADARFRGLCCGVKYAEGFIRVDAWGRIPAKRVLP